MSKKIKRLSDIEQTNGSLDDVYEHNTLDQILGEASNLRYETLDEKEYKNYLLSLNKTDLYSHAVSLGIMPSDNRSRLETRLMNEFFEYTAKYKTPRTKELRKDISPKKLQKALEIMKDGR